MYMLLFCGLTVAGSWVAWRHNPMYSTRSTLRMLAAVLLMIAGMVGVIVTASNVAIRQPQAVALTIMFSVVAVLTMAMIWGIMQLSTPKVAAVPVSVTMLRFHRHKLGVWLKRWLGAMLLVAVLAIVLPGVAQGIAWAVGGLLVLIGPIMLFAGYNAARNQDRALTALEYNPWMHWQYSPAQWEAWTEAQVARAKAVPPTFIFRRDWKKLVLPVVIIFGCLLLFGPGGWQWKAGYVLVIFGLLLGFALLAGKDGHAAPERTRADMKRAARETYLGEEGIFSGGALTPWICIADWLLEATVDNSVPRSLCLRFEKIAPGGGGTQMSAVNQRVLLPDDAEHDLARLQRELTVKCPKARILLC